MTTSYYILFGTLFLLMVKRMFLLSLSCDLLH